MSARRRPLTDAPDRLAPEQRERIRAWAVARWPHVERHLGAHWAECRDYHLSRGILRADWEATFRSWMRMAEKFAERDGERRPEPRLRVLRGGRA